jgi:hypothetical protein
MHACALPVCGGRRHCALVYKGSKGKAMAGQKRNRVIWPFVLLLSSCPDIQNAAGGGLSGREKPRSCP